MNDETIDMEAQEQTVTPQEFIGELYEIVKAKSRRDSVYRQDFLFEMIPYLGDVWWMSVEHPLALMLAQNGYASIQSFKGDCGDVVVYQSSDVNRCVDSIIEYCKSFGYAVES